ETGTLSDTTLEDGPNALGPDAGTSAGTDGASSAGSLSAHPEKSGRLHPGSASGQGETSTSPRGMSSSTSAPHNTATPKQPTSSAPSSHGPAAARGIAVWSHASRRCIDVPGTGRDGTQLQIWDCTGSAAQHWQFMSDGTVRALGKCMKVAGGSTSS